LINLSKPVQSLAKFMDYVLGRHPDEFGLIPDDHGFVKIKELLKALHEEPGWGYLRPDHLNELQFNPATNVIEMQEDKVRARERGQLPQVVIPPDLPKLLYTAIRSRAHPFVHDQGLRPSSLPEVVLSNREDMALRLGKRIDPRPVVLTVQVSAAQSEGVQFKQYGETLFLAGFIPADALLGPPLPKTPAKPKAPKGPSAERPRTPGSYFPNADAIEDPGSTDRSSRRSKKDWKQDRSQSRRHKERQRRGD
jgi:putative RNA 2'-phosphotransferase